MVLLNDAIFICEYSGAGRTVAGRARRVTSLELGKLSDSQFSGNQLSGEIPPELANLTELTHLFLAGNQLSGRIPSELSHLTNLTGLSLTDNQLSGCLPAVLRNVAHNELARLVLPIGDAP